MAGDDSFQDGAPSGEESAISYSTQSSYGDAHANLSAEREREQEKNLPNLSHNNSASRNRSTPSGTRHDASYNRNYQLSNVKHKKHSPERVQRSSSGSNPPAWNSGLKNEENPKEELPKIELQKKSKYNYLAEGKSSSGARKKDYYHLANDDDEEARWLCEASDHMSEKSYLHEIRKKLDSVDFEDALQSAIEEGPHTERCRTARTLFKVFSKNKELITPEDLHELLLLFTPPGVALREASDFLWEECDQKSSLNFIDFLRYGEVLRLRLLDFETFSALNSEQKLLVTSARVFPGVPTTDPEKARIRLMMANRQQADGNSSPEVRPLRIYEHLFLDFYQRKLYRDGVPPEERPSSQKGELSSELPSRRHHYRRDSEEDICWGDEEPMPPVAADKKEYEHRESDYPALANCNRSNPKAQKRVKRGKALKKAHQPKQPALGTRPGNIPFAQRQKPPFNLELQNRPSSDKYIGRILEDEYEERRTADDYLLQRIQENFMYA